VDGKESNLKRRLNTADQVHPFMEAALPGGNGHLKQDNRPAALPKKIKWLKDGLNNTKTGLGFVSRLESNR